MYHTGSYDLILFFGGGEDALSSVISKPTFGGLRNWDWSGHCLFPLREMTGSRQMGVGIIGGGGERFWDRFYGMFPPVGPRVFHPLLPLSELHLAAGSADPGYREIRTRHPAWSDMI